MDVEAAEPESPAAPHSVICRSNPLAVRCRRRAGSPLLPADTKPVNEEKVCRSPVSGIVVRVAAQVGQTPDGDMLLVLEAMKMETNITAPVGGQDRRHQGESGR